MDIGRFCNVGNLDSETVTICNRLKLRADDVSTTEYAARFTQPPPRDGVVVFLFSTIFFLRVILLELLPRAQPKSKASL